MNNRFNWQRFGEEAFHGDAAARQPERPWQAGDEEMHVPVRGVSSGPLRLVLLDGDPSLRRRLCKRLRGGGYLAFEAHDVAEAQVLVDAAQPDAVLVNISLPVLGTGGFLKRFSDDPLWAGVPLIVFTPHMSGPLVIRRPVPAGKVVGLPDGSPDLVVILSAIVGCLRSEK